MRHRRTRPRLRGPAGAAADLACARRPRRLARRGARGGGQPAAGWCRCGARTGGRRPAAFAVCAAYALLDGLAWLDSNCRSRRRPYPDLAPVFPVRRAHAARDAPTCSASRRRRGRHAALARPRRLAGRRYPLRHDDAGRRGAGPGAARDYPFVRVEGDGVHEIAVGPVHAGIIEPGHFRFSVVGEKVLRLEERLGYTHKGIERRFTRAGAAGRASAGRPRVGRFDRGLRLGLLHGARVGRGLRDARARADGCAR